MLGPYRLLQKVGEGGMGEVWRAEQGEPLRRQVAIKVIKAGMDTRQVVARFEAERQALALMDHPGIARVYDAGETPRGLPYFAMEYVPGEPITTYADRHRLGMRERLELFRDVCAGVQHAHQKGVIHRDLKPSNVLVTVEGGKALPKIIDFGVAKATSQRLTEKTLYTELGVLVGTPEYMSPEQAEMTGLDVDTRTDVYALGVMLYELLTGALPFGPRELRQAGFEEIRRRIREVDPPRPSTRVRTLGEDSAEAAKNRRTDPGRLVSRLKGDLDWIVMKAMEKDRTRRYGSPGEMAADVERHLKHEPVMAGPPGAGYRARKFVRRHRFGVAVAAAGVAALVGFSVTMAGQARRIARERDRAERVSQFLVELFRVSDPGLARGNTITAREVLDRGAERIEKELGGEPLVQAQLMATMGWVYRNLGLYAKAEPLCTRAVDLRRRTLGAEHPDTLRTQTGLAAVYRFQGRDAEAEDLLRVTSEAQRRVLGSDHPDALSSYSDLGVIYERQGRATESGKIKEAVLASRRRVLGDDHPDTLWSMNNVAWYLLTAGRHEEAEPLFREAIERRNRVSGADHPDTLWVTNNLGQLLRAQGRLAEAEQVFLKVLDARRRVLGAEHLTTLKTMTDLAMVYAEQRRFSEGETLYLEALATLRRTIGPVNLNTLVLMTNMGELYIWMERSDDAERVYRESHEIGRRLHAEQRIRSGEAAYNLACLMMARGRRAEALDWLRKAVEVGFSDADAMAENADLEPLRGDPGFQALVAGMRAGAEPKGETAH
jgi:non-specific serine/threonine protein kinase/serine/threonine-protein kinase